MLTRLLDVPKLGEDGHYHYLYMIVNSINQKFYVGIHSSDNIHDNYLGSGTRLQLAYKKYKYSNFVKYIFRFVNNEEEMRELEKQIVNEDLYNNDSCYNLTEGGGYLPSGHCVVKDKTGKTFSVSVNDPNIGILYEHVNKGKVTVKDNLDNYYSVSQDSEEFTTRKLVGVNKGFAIMKDRDGNNMRVPLDDPRIQTGELVSVVKSTVSVEDSQGRRYRIPVGDPRLQTGEFRFHTKGRVTIIDDEGRTRSVFKTDPILQTNKFKYVNQGRTYVNNGIHNKLVYYDQANEYISQGWKPGVLKQGSILVNKNGKRMLIKPENLEEYLKDGWSRGQGKTRPKSGRPKDVLSKSKKCN